MKVSWDETRNRTNRKKHGISFEEARAVAADDYLEIFDDEHSETEERFIAVGLIVRGVVVVVWTESDDGSVRIISARFATNRETKLYELYMGKKR